MLETTALAQIQFLSGIFSHRSSPADHFTARQPVLFQKLPLTAQYTAEFFPRASPHLHNPHFNNIDGNKNIDCFIQSSHDGAINSSFGHVQK